MICLVEKMIIESASLTIQGVGEYSDGGFLEKVAVLPRGEGGSGGSFQSANEAFDLPALAVSAFPQVLRSHGAAPGATQRPVLLVAGRFDDAFQLPFSPAQLMDPVGVVARVGIEQGPSFSQRVGKTLLQQSESLTLIVTRSEIHHQAQGQEAAANDCEREFHPAPPGVSGAGRKVGASGRGLHARSIHRDRYPFSRLGLLAQRPLPDLADHSIGDRQHFAPGTEFLQGRKVGQLLFQPKSGAQPIVSCQNIKQPAISRLQVGAQNQTSHQLALSEVMPAARRSIIGQMPLSKIHGQCRDAL